MGSPRDRHFASDGKPKTAHTRAEALARVGRIKTYSASPTAHLLGAYECHCGAWHIGKPAQPKPRRMPYLGVSPTKRSSVHRHPDLLAELGPRATDHLLRGDRRLLAMLGLRTAFSEPLGEMSKGKRQSVRAERRRWARLVGKTSSPPIRQGGT